MIDVHDIENRIRDAFSQLILVESEVTRICAILEGLLSDVGNERHNLELSEDTE